MKLLNAKLLRVFGVALCAVSFNVLAQDGRHIHVNGECLDQHNIQLADQLFQTQVPDGFYWINFETGEWGIEGQSATLGVLTTIANARQQNQSQQSTGRTEINQSQNGSVVSGEHCTYASVGGTTVRLCD